MTPEHSHLGGSGAERWTHCPGSTALLNHMDLPQTEEADYTAKGTCAHAAAAWCLNSPGMEAWELIGQEFHGIEVDKDMAEAVQVYIDICLAETEGATLCGTEERVSFPEHEAGFGTVDFWNYTPYNETLHIWDYKNGFMTVEVPNNPQFMYYAFALLHDPRLQNVKQVQLGVVQPNGFHSDGPVRTWMTTRDEIMAWGNDVLVPAMQRAEADNSLDAGPWCRFCPAKLVCPLLTGLFGAASKANPASVVNLTDERVGQEWQQIQAVKFYIKAVDDEAFRRKNLGHDVPGVKLVMKRADRVWKPDGLEVIKARLGNEIYTEPALKSPAQVEKLGGQAPGLVKEWAYTPQAGLTLAAVTDNRVEVRTQSAAQTFAAILDTPAETV